MVIVWIAANRFYFGKLGDCFSKYEQIRYIFSDFHMRQAKFFRFP